MKNENSKALWQTKEELKLRIDANTKIIEAFSILGTLGEDVRDVLQQHRDKEELLLKLLYFVEQKETDENKE